MSITHGKSTYRYLQEANGQGIFAQTDCCNSKMYIVDNDPMRFHGRLCPKCFMKNKYVTLYLRGTAEGIRVFEQNRKDGENHGHDD